MAANVLIVYILAFWFLKVFTKNELVKCEDCEACYKKYFVLVYEEINRAGDWIRKNSIGINGLGIGAGLFVIQKINISLFGIAWIVAVWSFVEPGLLKFFGIDLCELVSGFLKNSPLNEKIYEVYSLIPRASVVKKSE